MQIRYRDRLSYMGSLAWSTGVVREVLTRTHYDLAIATVLTATEVRAQTARSITSLICRYPLQIQ